MWNCGQLPSITATRSPGRHAVGVQQGGEAVAVVVQLAVAELAAVEDDGAVVGALPGPCAQVAGQRDLAMRVDRRARHAGGPVALLQGFELREEGGFGGRDTGGRYGGSGGHDAISSCFGWVAEGGRPRRRAGGRPPGGGSALPAAASVASAASRRQHRYLFGTARQGMRAARMELAARWRLQGGADLAVDQAFGGLVVGVRARRRAQQRLRIGMARRAEHGGAGAAFGQRARYITPTAELKCSTSARSWAITV